MNPLMNLQLMRDLLTHLWLFFKHGLRKALMVLCIITLVVALSPLALFLGGLLMVFALIGTFFILIGAGLGISGLVWVIQWLFNNGSGRALLPWI